MIQIYTLYVSCMCICVYIYMCIHNIYIYIIIHVTYTYTSYFFPSPQLRGKVPTGPELQRKSDMRSRAERVTRKAQVNGVSIIDQWEKLM